MATTPRERDHEQVDVEELPASAVDGLRTLWLSLLAHHRDVTPTMRTRAPEESWLLRRRQYLEFLGFPGSFCLVARRGPRIVGYAMVRVGEGDETWDTGARMAELETLSVAPDSRGMGIGRCLMDAVDARLAEARIGDLFVAAVATNERAIAFYRRRSLEPYLWRMHRRL